MSSEARKLPTEQTSDEQRKTGRWVGWTLVALAAAAAWWFVYANLERFANWLVYGALGMTPGSRLASAIAFFVYEAPKVLMLLLLVVFYARGIFLSRARELAAVQGIIRELSIRTHGPL